MLSRTSLAATAAFPQGTHNALLSTAVARLLTKVFPQYFDKRRADYITEQRFEQEFQPFTRNGVKNPMLIAIQRHFYTIDDDGAENLSFARDIITYLNDRFSEPENQWDTASYYEYQGENPGLLGIVLPIKRVFYCVFQLLQCADFLDVQLSSAEKMKVGDRRVYDFAMEMQNLKSGGSNVCHTGVRHWLMLPLQGLEVYLPQEDRVERLKHVLYFPAGSIEEFIDEQIADLIEIFLGKCRAKNIAEWLSFMILWVKPKTQRSAAERERLISFITLISEYLQNEKVAAYLIKTIFKLGINANKHVAIIREKMSVDNLLLLTPHYPDTFISHIRQVISLTERSDPKLVQRNEQLRILQAAVLTGELKTTVACEQLAAELAGFFGIEFLRNHFRRYAPVLLMYNFEGVTLERLRILLQSYDSRGIDCLALSEEEKRDIERFKVVLSQYQSDPEIVSITNFFALLFIGADSPDYVVMMRRRDHAFQIYSEVFQVKFRLTDEAIRQLMDRAGSDGVLEITPYEINRIFLHALSLPASEWSELFSRAFAFVLEYVNRLARGSAVGLDENLIRTSYPLHFLQLLTWMSRCRGDEDISREAIEDSSYIDMHDVARRFFIGSVHLIRDRGFLAWIQTQVKAVIIDFLLSCPLSMRDQLGQLGLLNFTFVDVVRHLKSVRGRISMQRLIDLLGLDRFRREVNDIELLAEIFDLNLYQENSVLIKMLEQDLLCLLQTERDFSIIIDSIVPSSDVLNDAICRLIDLLNRDQWFQRIESGEQMTEILRALHFTHLRIHFLKLFRTAFIIEQLSARKNQGWVGSMLGRMENNAECDQFVSALSGREFLARCGATFLKGLTTGHVDMSVQWFCASYPDVIARMFKQPGFPQELYSLLNNGIYCLTPSIERQKRFRRNAMYDYIAITMMDETIPACDDDLIKLLSGFSFTYLIFRMNDAGLNKMRGVLNTSEKLKQVLFYDMQVPICDIEILDEQMQGICRFFGKPPIRSSRDVVETLCCVDVGSRSAVINLLFRADRPSWFDRAASEDITAVMEVRSVALYNKVTRDLLCDYAASCPQGSSALQRGFFSSQNVVDPIPSVSSIIRDALADENNKIPEDYVRAIKARLVTDEKADELLLELNHILALIENMVSNSVSCSVFASDTFVRGCLRN